MKQKTRILIYILIAVAVMIMGTLAILGNHNADTAVSAQEHIDLGRIYLVELSYEKAVLEFTEAIEIEPLNADAYLGLAEAYVGMGDPEKAVETLEKGYDKTGDERLKDMLEELLPPPEETTVITTEGTTTASTVAMAIVPDLSGLSEEEAIAACEAARLKYSISYNYNDSIEKGYVVSQVIPMNASVAEGISVPFTVSEGAKIVTIVATTITTTTPVPAEKFITIKGEKYSTSLTRLDLRGMDLQNKDIKDLDKMSNLKVLLLNGNQISDIDILKNLTNLTHLYLYNNQIKDITALENLTNLTHLGLSGNQIDDINALEKIINLSLLELNHNKITNINVLKNLTNLSWLSLHNNQIADISALENLTNLHVLTLNENIITDINILNKLTNLTNLSLQENPLKDEDIDELCRNLPNCKIAY